jgi:hypothetical protein
VVAVPHSDDTHAVFIGAANCLRTGTIGNDLANAVLAIHHR